MTQTPIRVPSDVSKLGASIPYADLIPEEYFRNSLDLNRFSNKISREIVQSYNRIIINAVNKLEAIERLPVGNRPRYTAARLRSLLVQTKESLKKWDVKSTKDMQLVSEAVAKLQTEFATDQMEKALPAGIRSSIRTVEVTPAFAKAVVNTSASQLNVQILSDSLNTIAGGAGVKFSLTAKEGELIELPNGESIRKSFRGITNKSADKLGREIRDGLLAGDTTQQIRTRLIGQLRFNSKGNVRQIAMAGGNATRAANYQIMTIVRTSLNQVSNVAAQQVYKANPDATKKYRYLATLDSRTSSRCRLLDQQIFEYGKGPEPPQHFNCRSRTVAEIDYDNLSRVFGRKIEAPRRRGFRPSESGLVPAGQSYGTWLSQQSPAVKAKALGANKVRFFDKLSKKYGGDQAIRKFASVDGSEKTLAQLQAAYGKNADKIKIVPDVVRERKSAPYTWQRYSNGSLAKDAEPSNLTKWTPERQKLHDQIVEDIIAENNPRAQKNPIFYMTGGGSASGKSIMLKKSPLKKGTVVIDSDEIKKRLPEFKAMQAKGGKISEAAAGYVHEESSWISKRLMRECAQRRYHTMLDGTGDGSLKSLSGKIKMMTDRGMTVRAKYATAEIATALERNYQRFLKTKRLVPPKYVRNVHRDVSKVVPEAIRAGVFDDFELYDMNKTGEAVLVATFTKKDGLKIVNNNLYGNFLAKADQPNSLFTKWTEKKKR
jgi:SPP1 gp7 family putative phage head morphogenesis protein